MRAVFSGHPHRVQALPGSSNEAVGGVGAADEKRPRDRSVCGFLLLQIAILLALVSIHFGLLIDGHRHRAAGATESVIVTVLVAGLLLTWTSPPWNRRTATIAQSFGIVGVLVGLVAIALGVRPRTILDLTLNGGLLLTLIAGLAMTLRKL